MLSTIQNLLEARIDFEGQKLVEQIVRLWLILATVLAFALGFGLQSLRITFGTLGVSLIGLSLVILPPWPMYNRHPVQWLPPVKETKSE
ncbi:microsomal signal peptidase 12 kDa subunit [Obba rivulosa]|uniref:Signal peptidase complex subunit 1 n=1 Tax=Obba rivulosa TaxID=1052685 RepID=A0A8E2AU27_9APHY|nr:microsomal signal peptidase 12 kDa subunit [Obba rivulosa]